jgi:hypothetical protein
MDIKSLIGTVGVKNGPQADVKNRGSVGLSCEDEPKSTPAEFAKILATEDSKMEPLETENSKDVQPSADGVQVQAPPLPPPLALPHAELYSASVSVALLGRDQLAPEGGIGEGSQGQISLVDGAALNPAKAEAPQNLLTPGEVGPLPAPPSGRVGTHGDVPYAGAVLKLSAAAALPGVGELDPEKRSGLSLPVGAEINLLLPDLKAAKSATHLGSFKNAGSTKAVTDIDSNLSKPPAQWSLNEAGKKNESLLDVLARGEGALRPEGLTDAVKPGAFVFQREGAADDTRATYNQSVPPSQPSTMASSQLAEKSSYWVANGTQTLALTLGGQGEESVAVKIALSGLDARVDIRTDHLALRQMIEGSVQEMKDKLSTEGLTLSELSVGTSRQDQSAGQNMARDSQKRGAPEVTSSHSASQSTGLKNMALTQERRALPVGSRKLSVFA